MKIVSSDLIKRSIQKDVKEKYPEIEFVFCRNIEEAEPELKDAEVLLTYGNDITDSHIEQAYNLKWIMVMSAGIERMPFEKIAEKQILLTNSSGIHAIPMAEYTIANMLNVYRKVPVLLKNQENRVWDRVRMQEISGKTIAVIGAGAIGKEIARLSKAFRMTTLGYNRSGRQAENFDEMFCGDQLKDLLPRADFVVSVLPGTKATENLFGKEQFKAMKKEAVFINIGRGSTVCENALIEALHNGEIAHAVLDVFKKEPLDDNSPLWSMENVTITPHVSGVSPAYQDRVFEIFEHNLSVYRSGNGNYINQVDLKKGY
ncbi:D-2-hydroxyacid dehydrogenase [Pueribacillus theae]|uniref:D-2-hydroxyacid dehydrogenase n=1 Tax=Pueribacillus theae TaxID=2171751 RepID=A0A2U1JSM1_9BACI|nr:D-2-hydroxyacid dehydrogenase [Pueribacillus theae]PWA07808.1 D-2-hydroxyacid dehydrogenase [Pueribacillus theae]